MSNHPTIVRVGGIIAAIVMALALVAPVAAQPITRDNVDHMVAVASTSADHAALAAFFAKQAHAAELNARRYQAKLTSDRRKRPAGKECRGYRCQRLIAHFEREKSVYLARSAEQEELARRVAH